MFVPHADRVNSTPSIDYLVLYSARSGHFPSLIYSLFTHLCNYLILICPQEEKSFERRGAYTELEDHTFHFKHNDFVKTTVEATDGATR